MIEHLFILLLLYYLITISHLIDLTYLLFMWMMA